MNPKLAKMLAKGAVGIPITMALGLLVRVNHKIDDRIDEHYDSKDPDKTENE
jgi:hypothetical protein